MAGICKLVLTTSGTRRVRELPRGDVSLRIGNTPRCELRVEEGPEGPVEVYLNSRDGIWTLERADNAYIARDGVRCALPRKLKLRDELEVRLSDTEQTAFRMELMLDLDNVTPKYDRIVDIHNADKLVVGGIETADLYIKDGMLGHDQFTLFQRGGSLMLADDDSRWGVFVNGVRVDGECPVKNTDFISLMGYSFYYKNGCLYTDSRDDIRLQGLHSVLSGVRSVVSEYPKFVRNVRKKIVLSKEEITVLDPPQKQQKPKNNIFLQLLPAVGSVLLVVFLRGAMGGGGSYVAFSACSMGLGALTTVISFVAGNRDYKKETAAREKEYRDYIERKTCEIEKAREQEAAQLARIYCDPQVELQRVWDFSGDLFDRQEGDEDFLRIFLGKGEKTAVRPVKITEKESITVDDELFKIPRQLLEKYRYISDAPVYLHTKDDNAIGVVGDSARLREMMKLMSLDLASRHYYTDLKLAYLVGPSGMGQFPWIRWLPHVKNDALGARSIVCDEESKNAMFEFLYVELSAREQQKRSWPRYVVFVLDDYGLKSHPISKYIGRAKDLGFTFIFMESREELLPQECNEVVALERASDRGTVYRTDNLNEIQHFTCHPIRDREMWDAAVALSPIYSEEVSLESALTKSLTFFEMLGITSPADIDLKRNWNKAAVDRSLAAPLGVDSKDEIVYLDLHERAHGPHGLVAGTTGSGKSELLQSYILSMAICFHPYEVGFVIIDFKGGGMANQFKDLPHLVGAITNIDGAAIQRSLKSIKAELQKRQRLFAEADVNKIDDYIKLYKDGKVNVPLPHLILIVDEFAELKAEQPEFMKELISAARIGRSLGVHLILATQKPSGQVDEQIWSNSRFKLCLKVQDARDSNEVLKSPLAAEIKEPGRAYLQVGNNEIFELFQSAYSGAPAVISDVGIQKEYDIYSVSVSGKRKSIFSQRKGAGARSNSRNQLEVIVEYVQKYCEKNGISHLPNICLPPLPECVRFQKQQAADPIQTTVTIGVYDDPEKQYQGFAELNLSAGNTIAIGSSQTGKTNLLQTIVKAVAENYSPEEVTMYIIDFNSMILKNFENLAHVGGVVTASEDEALKNLFKLLFEEVAKRKDKLVQTGVSSFISYREAGKRDLPQIILLIDNLTALKELYFQDEDALLSLCRDGLAVGISVVVANSQTSGIGYRYLSSFSNRMVLFCNDSGEYSSVFEHSRLGLPNITGRCIMEIDKSLYECQTFLAFEGDKEFERVNAMRSFVQQINERYGGRSAAAEIPVIPKVLTEEMLADRFARSLEPYHIIAGLDYATVSPVVLDMTRQGLLAISGRQGMGRSNFIRHLLYSLEQNRARAPVSVCIIDDLQQKLSGFQKLHIVSEYSLSAEKAMETIGEWDAELKRRYDLLMAGEVGAIETAPLLLMIIQNTDIASEIGDNRECLAKYKNFFAKYKAMKVAVIYSNMENANIPYGAPETIKPLRETHHFLFFDDLPRMKLFDVPALTARKYKKAIEAGDCYLTTEDGITKLRTVFCDKV